jgi:hypothetical protein
VPDEFDELPLVADTVTVFPESVEVNWLSAYDRPHQKVRTKTPITNVESILINNLLSGCSAQR